KMEITPRLFGKKDGLVSAETYGSATGTVIKTASGELWFATKNGIAIFNPEKVKIRKDAPFVHIEKVTLNGSPVDPVQENAVLAVDEPSAVKLYFTSPQFDLRKQVFFKYRLEGYDREWRRVEPGESRNAEYRDLPPGDYRFFVTGCNSDGVWNKEAVKLSFYLKPSFWETAWPYISIVFIILLAAFLI
ncbi:MAG: hypothetical protein GY940_11915, partial [bacterium]|nr:hypothetical protein [bacterium]